MVTGPSAPDELVEQLSALELDLELVPESSSPTAPPGPPPALREPHAWRCRHPYRPTVARTGLTDTGDLGLMKVNAHIASRSPLTALAAVFALLVALVVTGLSAVTTPASADEFIRSRPGAGRRLAHDGHAAPLR